MLVFTLRGLLILKSTLLAAHIRASSMTFLDSFKIPVEPFHKRYVAEFQKYPKNMPIGKKALAETFT